MCHAQLDGAAICAYRQGRELFRRVREALAARGIRDNDPGA